MRLQPEERILLLASRTGLEPDAVAELGELVRAQPDWTKLTRLALVHNVTPLLRASLARLPPGLVPAELTEAMDVYCGTVAERSERWFRELVKLLAALEEAGVAAVPFKGPVLAAQAYGDLRMRPCADLDVLVARRDVARTLAVLAERGFEQRDGPQTAFERRVFERHDASYLLVRAADGVNLEPHWTVSPWTTAVDLDDAALRSRARPVRIEKATVPSFSPEDTLLLLAVHAAKHSWMELRWICDIAELLRRTPELDLGAAHARARACGCRRALEATLEIASACLGSPRPDGIAVDRKAARIAERFPDDLFRARRETPEPYRLRRAWLELLERPSDKARYLWRTITTPRLRHVRMVRLPRGLRWLYGPLKVAHDYVALPLWRIFRRTATPSSSAANGNA